MLNPGPQPLSTYNVCPQLSVLPDRFEGYLQLVGPAEGALPSGLTGLSTQGSVAALGLAIRQGDMAGLQTLQLTGNCDALVDRLHAQKLRLPNLTRLWLDTWRGSPYHPDAGLWLDLFECKNLHTLACSFRPAGEPDIDLVTQLPESLKHLYILDSDPSAFAHLSRFPVGLLKTLVVYIAEAHLSHYRRRYDWTAAAMDAEMLVERVRITGVAFWPTRLCAYLQDMDWGQDRNEWTVSPKEQQAAFMAGRLPKFISRS